MELVPNLVPMPACEAAEPFVAWMAQGHPAMNAAALLLFAGFVLLSNHKPPVRWSGQGLLFVAMLVSTLPLMNAILAGSACADPSRAAQFVAHLPVFNALALAALLACTLGIAWSAWLIARHELGKRRQAP